MVWRQKPSSCLVKDRVKTVIWQANEKRLYQILHRVYGAVWAIYHGNLKHTALVYWNKVVLWLNDTSPVLVSKHPRPHNDKPAAALLPRKTECSWQSCEIGTERRRSWKDKQWVTLFTGRGITHADAPGDKLPSQKTVVGFCSKVLCV